MIAVYGMIVIDSASREQSRLQHTSMPAVVRHSALLCMQLLQGSLHIPVHSYCYCYTVVVPVVVSVKAVYECLYVRLVQVANITSSLPWLLSQHHQLWIDQSEAVNHYLHLFTLPSTAIMLQLLLACTSAQQLQHIIMHYTTSTINALNIGHYTMTLQTLSSYDYTRCAALYTQLHE
jgi:hypothetical protein